MRAIGVVMVLGGCSTKSGSPPPVAPAAASLPCEDVSGVLRCVLVEGPGDVVEPGPVALHYTGWLSDGTRFDASRDRGKPFRVELGQGNVIEGWDLAVPGMRYGGRYRLTIPPDLGYGARGAGDLIPPYETLIFEVEPLFRP